MDGGKKEWTEGWFEKGRRKKREIYIVINGWREEERNVPRRWADKRNVVINGWREEERNVPRRWADKRNIVINGWREEERNVPRRWADKRKRNVVIDGWEEGERELPRQREGGWGTWRGTRPSSLRLLCRRGDAVQHLSAARGFQKGLGTYSPLRSPWAACLESPRGPKGSQATVAEREFWRTRLLYHHHRRQPYCRSHSQGTMLPHHHHPPPVARRTSASPTPPASWPRRFNEGVFAGLCGTLSQHPV
jgi:hypothetical protein